jgi:hypothetical protein
MKLEVILMPRMDPFRKRSPESVGRRRDRQEPIAHFLRNLLFPAGRPSEYSKSESSTTDKLLEALSPIWDTVIAPTLLSEFGSVETLHAIFYAEDESGEVILEIWDPSCVDSKPSEVFRLTGISNTARRLPESRSKAEVLTLESWY